MISLKNPMKILLNMFKIKYLIKAVSLNFFLILLLLYSLGESSIIVDSQSATKGEKVTFSIKISPEPNDISAFGFEIRFDSNMLKYTGFSPSPLAQKFKFFNLSQPSDGILRAGAISINPIKINGTTNLANIDFTCINCSKNESLIEISRKFDDFSNWQAIPGIFSCIAEDEEDSSEEIKENKNIIELTNKDTPSEKLHTDHDNLHGVNLYKTKKSSRDGINNQGYTIAGGGWGSNQELIDTSGLSAVYGGVPCVNETIPKDEATGIKLDSTIELIFNKSMDHMAVENAFMVFPNVKGQFKWKNYLTELEFVPYSPLSPGIIYKVHLTDQAKDIYGQFLDGDRDGTMGGEYCFSFQTVEDREFINNKPPETIPPCVTRCFIMTTLYDKDYFFVY